MTLKPELLKTSQVMESAFLGGSVFSNDFVESLDCFSGMSSFKHLYLGNIRLREEGAKISAAVRCGRSGGNSVCGKKKPAAHITRLQEIDPARFDQALNMTRQIIRGMHPAFPSE